MIAETLPQSRFLQRIRSREFEAAYFSLERLNMDEIEVATYAAIVPQQGLQIQTSQVETEVVIKFLRNVSYLYSLKNTLCSFYP